MHTNYQQTPVLMLPTNRSIEVIEERHIVRIQSISNYSKLFFANGQTLVVAKVLRWFEEKLPEGQFIRIHRTHIINKGFIRSYINGSGGKICLLNGEQVDVAKRRRGPFLRNWKAGLV
jgi:two-component system LytT family response regulator